MNKLVDIVKNNRNDSANLLNELMNMFNVNNTSELADIFQDAVDVLLLTIMKMLMKLHLM